MLLVRSLFYFVLAGLCEIGGGYLMWQWLRVGKPLLWGILGDGITPDRFDIAGAVICLLGVFIIMYWPR